MTEDLRDALHRAATAGEPAVGDAFARFAAVKRRAAIARSATVAVVGLTAAATLFFMLPGLNSGDSGGSLTGGDATSSPPFKPVKHYEDRAAGFAFDYPSSWDVFNPSVGRSVDVAPAGDEALSVDTKVAFDCGAADRCAYVAERPTRTNVRVTWRDPAQVVALLASRTARGAVVATEPTLMDGRAGERHTITFPAEPSNLPHISEGPHPGYMFTWCASCEIASIVIPRWTGTASLLVEITSPAHDPASSADIDVIIQSLARA